MSITVKYFGQLTEITNCSFEDIDTNAATISEALNALFKKYPALEQMDFQVAQNCDLVTEKTKITAGEIALLPAFSGG